MPRHRCPIPPLILSDVCVLQSSVSEISATCSTVLTMLPNDAVVEDVSAALLRGASSRHSFTHISCSTVSPTTARGLAVAYKALNHQYISAPVFARPDGIAKKQAYWLVSGQSEGRGQASGLLGGLGKVYVPPTPPYSLLITACIRWLILERTLEQAMWSSSVGTFSSPPP